MRGESNDSSTESTKLLAINDGDADVYDYQIGRARRAIVSIRSVGKFINWLLVPWDHPMQHYKPERLALFGDAVASIIATFMILPMIEGFIK